MINVRIRKKLNSSAFQRFSCDSPAGLGKGVEGDGKYDDDADNDLLDVRE